MIWGGKSRAVNNCNYATELISVRKLPVFPIYSRILLRLQIEHKTCQVGEVSKKDLGLGKESCCYQKTKTRRNDNCYSRLFSQAVYTSVSPSVKNQICQAPVEDWKQKNVNRWMIATHTVALIWWLIRCCIRWTGEGSPSSVPFGPLCGYVSL